MSQHHGTLVSRRGVQLVRSLVATQTSPEGLLTPGRSHRCAFANHIGSCTAFAIVGHRERNRRVEAGVLIIERCAEPCYRCERPGVHLCTILHPQQRLEVATQTPSSGRDRPVPCLPESARIGNVKDTRFVFISNTQRGSAAIPFTFKGTARVIIDSVSQSLQC
jgi:hypothetical protein